MDLVAVIQRYQRFNPETGEFDTERNIDQYATLLKVDQSYISRFYRGQRRTGGKLVQALLRTFPQAAQEVAAAMAMPAETPEPELAEAVS